MKMLDVGLVLRATDEGGAASGESPKAESEAVQATDQEETEDAGELRGQLAEAEGERDEEEEVVAATSEGASRHAAGLMGAAGLGAAASAAPRPGRVTAPAAASRVTTRRRTTSSVLSRDDTRTAGTPGTAAAGTRAAQPAAAAQLVAEEPPVVIPAPVPAPAPRPPATGPTVAAAPATISAATPAGGRIAVTPGPGENATVGTGPTGAMGTAQPIATAGQPPPPPDDEDEGSGWRGRGKRAWPFLLAGAVVVGALLAWRFWPSGDADTTTKTEEEKPTPAPALVCTELKGFVLKPGEKASEDAMQCLWQHYMRQGLVAGEGSGGDGSASCYRKLKTGTDIPTCSSDTHKGTWDAARYLYKYTGNRTPVRENGKIKGYTENYGCLYLGQLDGRTRGTKELEDACKSVCAGEPDGCMAQCGLDAAPACTLDLPAPPSQKQASIK